MEVLAFSWLVLGFLFCVALVKWNEVRYRGKCLPPGTMGWPLFGETLEFLKQGPFYMDNRRAKYGSLFKTHILGCPTVISMDPQLNRYILLNEGKGLVPGYPKSMVDLIGKTNMAAVHGSDHKLVRGSLISLVGPAAIKDQLFPYIDKFISCFIDNWDGKTLDIQQKTMEMAFYMTFRQLVEAEADTLCEPFKAAFDKVVTGTLSLPINIPGTNYHMGLQGRKRIIGMLKRVMAERRASRIPQNDMLAELIGDENTKYELNDEQIFDQVFVLLNSGYETVSVTTMMAIKYLHDHPKALEECREEHLAIRERKGPGEPIDWNDYKSMRFTRAVILETSRLATVVNGVLRRATKEVELNGFVIPKGWKMYVYTRELNYDPIIYPEPFTFDPWRWLQGKGLETHSHFFLFGGGTRLCPGKELGIVQISTFLHYFVTRYRWEQVGECKILRFPRVEVPNGMHLRISKY